MYWDTCGQCKRFEKDWNTLLMDADIFDSEKKNCGYVWTGQDKGGLDLPEVARVVYSDVTAK